jgi:hypothetical protein
MEISLWALLRIQGIRFLKVPIFKCRSKQRSALC